MSQIQFLRLIPMGELPSRVQEKAQRLFFFISHDDLGGFFFLTLLGAKICEKLVWIPTQ